MLIESNVRCKMEAPLDVFVDGDSIVVIDKYDHRMQCPGLGTIMQHIGEIDVKQILGRDAIRPLDDSQLRSDTEEVEMPL